MKYIIMDLEWQTGHVDGGCLNEIIEIGAVALDDNLSVTDDFQSFVRMKLSKKLKRHIKDLTHITDENLKNADGFITVFNRLKAWIGKDEDNCMLSWGNSDITVLYDNLMHYGMADEIFIIKHYCDAQLLCQKAVDIPLTRQIALVDFAEAAKVDLSEVTFHRAVNDSRVTAMYVAKLLTPELYGQFVHTADREFYERMKFKSYPITSFKDERIALSTLRMYCPECGDVYMKRMTKFSYRNKKHTAMYRCGLCGRMYRVNHMFRMTYDGLEHKHSLHEADAVPSDIEIAAEAVTDAEDREA